jgi:EAL domain-containing protein (putative c-di-GMP-specific phosphodiesterase class I)
MTVEHRPTPPAMNAVEVPQGRISVLVVDDDVLVATALQRLLSQRNHEVTLATDGNEAAEELTRRTFDVIVSDVRMPGMSGIDLLSVVRAYDLDVPVLLMTGSPNLDTAVEAVRLGAMEYLTKPVETEVLVRSISRAARLHELARLKRAALRLQGSVDAEAGDRAGLQVRFDRALEQLHLAVQPIVDFANRRVFGYEALVRSGEPSMSVPEALLGAAERLDSLPQLGRRIRSAAAKTLGNAPASAALFVNLHPRDLLDAELYEASAPLSRVAERVVLEITERTALDAVADVQARISVLRFMGYRIAIDDLGAGYAGLTSFAALAPDIVKLDMALVRGIHRSELRQRIVSSMTSLCIGLGMRVVAEGIEEAAERDCLVGAGCELLQGYLFAKPGPPFPSVAMLS